MILLKRAARRLKRALAPDPDRFLRTVRGVIHVGANHGQERGDYAKRGLAVLWIEPIPEVFATLCANLEGLRDQRALQSLVTDCDDVEYEFHVANNSGASSSILDFKEHKDVWPEVGYERTIKLRSRTLAALLALEGVDPAVYDALVMDTQGSELMVLKGAESLLGHFKFIKTEVPDFESYAGCCQIEDIEAFLLPRGYREYSRRKFASRAAGGSYYDIVYERATP